jgi:predicted dehydrogenase
MKTHEIGILMNGVTGRMGKNQHLVRSILAIQAQGGVELADGGRIIPRPLLLGRNAEKMKALAEEHGLPWSTDLDSALSDPAYAVYFDAQTTPQRYAAALRAIDAGKHVYFEKPSAETSAEALELYRRAEAKGVRHGVVQDKLWLPGFLKLKTLIDSGFFGQIQSVKGDFGYWVFTGEDPAQPAQRPSWNYRKADGGGIISDMLCHWRYVIDNLFGDVTAVDCLGATHVPRRVDEVAKPYDCDTDDAAYATFTTAKGIVCQFNSSWCTRVRRDDLLTIQVDGTHGSAVAGLRKCWAQSLADTPRPVWNPDIDSPIDFRAGWQEVGIDEVYDNAFKSQWELFLRHVVQGGPFAWDLLAGAKGVQLAELGLRSWHERRWLDVPALKP